MTSGKAAEGSNGDTSHERLLETRFPHHFEHLGYRFTLTVSDFGSDSEKTDENWKQVAVTTMPNVGRLKRLFSSPRPIEVGKLTLKSHASSNAERPQYEIMGNYNHTYGKREHIKGVIGAAVQQFALVANCDLFVSGVTHGGGILYERMMEKHDPSLVVEKQGNTYWIKPKD